MIIVLLISSLPSAVTDKRYGFSLDRPFTILQASKNFFMNVYNIIKDNLIETDLGNIKTMQESMILEDFESGDLSKLYVPKDHLGTARISIDTKTYYHGNASLKILMKLPFDSPLLISSESKYTNWKDYNFVNLWIKDDGFNGMFEFIIVDADGDWWHYYNKDVLKKQSWTLVKMPLKSFNNPEWTEHGNRKQNFENITKYFLKITPNKEIQGSYSINIDEIYLSDI